MTTVEAVILAGGLGTRLLPLTESTPKPLLPVAGVPFVVHQLAKLAAAGIGRVVLATSYHAEWFLPVLGDGSAWGLEIAYVTEVNPLGTGGAIRNSAAWLRSRSSDPVVILNSDILSGHDVRAQLAFHRQRSAEVTLHLVDVADARPYGCVPTDAAGNVTAFLEKSPDPVSSQINAGCYVFDRQIIDRIPDGEVASVERETFPQLLAGGCHVAGYLEPAYWLDVGTPEALRRASADLVRGVTSTPAYAEPPAHFWAASDAVISPAAALAGGTSVGPGATVGPRAQVFGSIVMRHAAIGAGAGVVDCVVGEGAQIGALAVVEDCVLGDHTVVPPDTHLQSQRVAHRGS